MEGPLLCSCQNVGSSRTEPEVRCSTGSYIGRVGSNPDLRLISELSSPNELNNRVRPPAFSSILLLGSAKSRGLPFV